MKIATKPVFLFSLLFFFLLMHDNYGQRPVEDQCPAKGSLIINEVGNLSETKFGTKAGEFIELLVTGNDPGVPVNLAGLIIDDNHSDDPKNNATAGHIRLGDCFSSVMPGTIILLYDDANQFPGIDPRKDGKPNAEGVYQIPFSDKCLVKVSDCPNYRDLSYGCKPKDFGDEPTQKGRGSWRDFLHLDDNQDVVQVRDEKGVLHALVWHPQTFTIAPVRKTTKRLFYPDYNSGVAVYVSANGVGGNSVFFKDDDHLKSSNFGLAPDGYTPGKPNNEDNAAFIANLGPMACPGEGIEIGCKGDGTSCYVWNDDASVVPLEDGRAIVYPVKNTRYTRTTIDQDGNLISVDHYRVGTHPAFSVNVIERQLNEADCPAQAMFEFSAAVSDTYESYSYLWSSGHKTKTVELLGDQTYTLTVTAPNGCTVVTEVTAQGDPELMASADIERSSDFLCGEQPVQLTVSLQNHSGD
ncbi:MAG: hypothetical protein AAF597_13650 [Bacteroidota bacterium]